MKITNKFQLQKTAPISPSVLLLILLSPINYVNNHQAYGQQQPIDEDLIDRWDDSIDFEGCFSDLIRADRDGNGYVKQNEYLNFIQEYGKRICFTTDSLTLQQSATFNTLACLCRQQEGTDSDCCLASNAKISTAGASDSRASRSAEDNSYLTSVCKLTDATIDARCPPVIAIKEEPDIPIIAPVSANSSGGGGMSDGAKWGLIAGLIALLLLLCCCCVCVYRRVLQKRREEEEEDEIVQTDVQTEMASNAVPITDLEKGNGDKTVALSHQGSDIMDEPALREFDPNDDNIPVPSDTKSSPISGDDDDNFLQNIPADVAPVAAMAGAMGATIGEDSDSDDETRKKSGGGTVPDEPDDERIICRGAPPLPPGEDPPPRLRQLRPIPDKEQDDDEWDERGRDIQFPVEKDDMSAGDVEHYEPDGGVYIPERDGKDQSDWNRNWNRAKPEEPDEDDKRKHRIQSGLGDADVWNYLDEDDIDTNKYGGSAENVLDWIIESALGALDGSSDDVDLALDPTLHDMKTIHTKNDSK